MAAFGSDTWYREQDTSPTAPASAIWTIRIGDAVLTSGDTCSSNTIYISATAASTDPPPILTKDEKRALIQWQNKLGFWSFVDWVTRIRSMSRVPTSQGKEKRSYGTSNGLRPTPMLC